ncbi:hypothetical protein UA70_22315 [Raoultella planticola]|nr:hypothetical protein UA70_22315 [Raoultella planticola]
MPALQHQTGEKHAHAAQDNGDKQRQRKQQPRNVSQQHAVATGLRMVERHRVRRLGRRRIHRVGHHLLMRHIRHHHGMMHAGHSAHRIFLQ